MISATYWTWAFVAIAIIVWPWGVVRTISAIRERSKHEQEGAASAESVAFAWSEKRLLEIMERYPRSATPAVTYALAAHRRRDWPETLRRYEVAIKRDRNDARGYAGAAAALRGLGRLDESEALLRQAEKRCPRRADLQQEMAWNAIARQDWQEAAHRWELNRQFSPDDRMAYEQGQVALRRAGRAEEADALAVEQKARFRDRFVQDAASD
jgi:tetratricopeptide (TPR) repeat protein